jgi:hypothetical protein
MTMSACTSEFTEGKAKARALGQGVDLQGRNVITIAFKAMFPFHVCVYVTRPPNQT